MEELLLLDPLFSRQLSFLSSFLSLARENWTKYDLPSMQLGVALLFFSLFSLFLQLVLLRSSSSSSPPPLFVLALFVFGVGGVGGGAFLPISSFLGGVAGVFLCYLSTLCIFFCFQLLRQPRQQPPQNQMYWWREMRMGGWMGVCLVLRVISLLSNSYIEAEMEVMRFFLVSSAFFLVYETSFQPSLRYFFFFSTLFPFSPLSSQVFFVSGSWVGGGAQSGVLGRRRELETRTRRPYSFSPLCLYLFPFLCSSLWICQSLAFYFPFFFFLLFLSLSLSSFFLFFPFPILGTFLSQNMAFFLFFCPSILVLSSPFSVSPPLLSYSPPKRMGGRSRVDWEWI